MSWHSCKENWITKNDFYWLCKFEYIFFFPCLWELDQLPPIWLWWSNNFKLFRKMTGSIYWELTICHVIHIASLWDRRSCFYSCFIEMETGYANKWQIWIQTRRLMLEPNFLATTMHCLNYQQTHLCIRLFFFLVSEWL